MKTLHKLACDVLATAILATGMSPAAAAPGDVRQSFDAPCKYPAGMACDGTHLYVLDWREAKIHRLSLADGKPQESFDAPTLRPQGLAYGEGKLFVCDDRSGWVYAMDLRARVVERSFEAPGSSPAGLAYAAGELFIMEQKTEKIYRVMPADGTIVGFIPAPTKNSAGLTHDGQYLWASDRTKNELYMLDPDSGTVLAILASPGPYPAGLAWHAGTLWNVDFQDRKVYQLTVQDSVKYRLSDPREARMEFLWVLYNYGPGELRDVAVSFAVPEPLPGQDLLSEVEYATPPTRTAVDRWDQRCAVFEIGALPGGTRRMLSYSVQARIHAIRYLIRPEETGTLDDIPADIHRKYTADGTRYRINTPYIQEVVKKVVGDEKNPYWIARKIFNHVIDKIEYEMVGGWDTPEVVLKRGKGSCSEYTFTFVALCRAAGLPARYEGSVVVRGDDASIDDAFHRWAEIYLPNYGWVPVDANKGDSRWPADQARGFGELANRFLITTRGGGDSELLEWGYNAQASYKAVGACKVVEETYGFWEPLKPPAPAAAAEPRTGPGCRP